MIDDTTTTTELITMTAPHPLVRKLTSRKFWALIGAVLAALGLYLQQQIDATALLAAIIAAAGTYQVGEGLADGGRGA